MVILESVYELVAILNRGEGEGDLGEEGSQISKGDNSAKGGCLVVEDDDVDT